MAFERFDKAAATAVTKDPEVVVAVSGVISLTWRAYEMIGTPDAVEFFFDRDKAVLALAPCSANDSNGYLVRKPRTAAGEGGDARGTVSVRGVSVLKYYEVDYSHKFRRKPYVEGDLLCFEVPLKSIAPAAEAPIASFTTEEPPA